MLSARAAGCLGAWRRRRTHLRLQLRDPGGPGFRDGLTEGAGAVRMTARQGAGPSSGGAPRKSSECARRSEGGRVPPPALTGECPGEAAEQSPRARGRQGARAGAAEAGPRDHGPGPGSRSAVGPCAERRPGAGEEDGSGE